MISFATRSPLIQTKETLPFLESIQGATFLQSKTNGVLFLTLLTSYNPSRTLAAQRYYEKEAGAMSEQVADIASRFKTSASGNVAACEA